MGGYQLNISNSTIERSIPQWKNKLQKREIKSNQKSKTNPVKNRLKSDAPVVYTLMFECSEDYFKWNKIMSDIFDFRYQHTLVSALHTPIIQTILLLTAKMFLSRTTNQIYIYRTFIGMKIHITGLHRKSENITETPIYRS